MGDLGSIPVLGRSPGEENSISLWYSGLGNSMDYLVHRVAKSQTRLGDFHLDMLVNVFRFTICKRRKLKGCCDKAYAAVSGHIILSRKFNCYYVLIIFYFIIF